MSGVLTALKHTAAGNPPFLIHWDVNSLSFKTQLTNYMFSKATFLPNLRCHKSDLSTETGPIIHYLACVKNYTKGFICMYELT